MSGKRNHQPDRSTSCNLRTATAIDGSKIARLKREPSSGLMRVNTEALVKANENQYQYSDLDALPEKVPYFLKQVLTASVKFINKNIQYF